MSVGHHARPPRVPSEFMGPFISRPPPRFGDSPIEQKPYFSSTWCTLSDSTAAWVHLFPLSTVVGGLVYTRSQCTNRRFHLPRSFLSLFYRFFGSFMGSNEVRFFVFSCIQITSHGLTVPSFLCTLFLASEGPPPPAYRTRSLDGVTATTDLLDTVSLLTASVLFAMATIPTVRLACLPLGLLHG